MTREIRVGDEVEVVGRTGVVVHVGNRYNDHREVGVRDYNGDLFAVCECHTSLVVDEFAECVKEIRDAHDRRSRREKRRGIES